VPFTETDRTLLSRCLNRESGAWEDFVDRFIGLFVHVIQNAGHARSILLQQDDIEDYCSDVFVTLLKNDFAVLRHFKGRSSLPAYLCVVARRVVVKSMMKRRKSEALGHVSAHRASMSTTNGTEPIQRIVDADEVRRLMEQLPSSEATIVRMYHIDGKSYQDISRELGIPTNSVGPTLARARERMKQLSVPNS